MNRLDHFFGVTAAGSTLKREIAAGIATFMTAAYIIMVNPAILSQSGMPFSSVMTATCLASGITTILMGLISGYPFVLSAAMGLNAFFAFSVVGKMGVSWNVALTAVFVEGILFILLTLTKIREAIVNGFPKCLQIGVSAGIGFFIALIGLKSSGLVVADSATLVSLGNLANPSVIVVLIGFFITLIMDQRGIKGAILWGIFITYGLSILAGLASAPQAYFSLPPSPKETFWSFDFSALKSGTFWGIVFTFFFVDFFDTVGMLVGLTNRAGLLDEKGKLPRASSVLMIDALGTTLGAILGTSTVTTMIESAAGVEQGGRTGLAACVTGILFLSALFLHPIVQSIPAFATSPALIVVGMYMMSALSSLDYKQGSDLAPALIVILTMAFTYSIGNGIEFGCLSYVFIKLGCGRTKEISPVMWLLALVFLTKEIIPHLI